MAIVYVDNLETCEIKIGDTIEFKDGFRPVIIVTEIRKQKPEGKPEKPQNKCPHCDGDLGDWLDA